MLGGAALTRNYVERDLREVYEGRALLRQGRVRGPAHDGHPHGRQEVRRRSTPSSGATPGGRDLPPRKSQREPTPRPTSRCRPAPTSPIDVPIFTPPFLGSRVAKGISLDDIAAYINETALFRNQWQFRPRRVGRVRRGVQGADPPDAAGPARRGQGRGLARARGRVGLLPGERRGRRPRRLDRRRPPDRAAAVPLPPPAQGPLPLHRRLLPARRVGRDRLRRLPRGDGRLRGHGQASRSCSPPTSTRSTCSPTACRSR